MVLIWKSSSKTVETSLVSLAKQAAQQGLQKFCEGANTSTAEESDHISQRRSKLQQELVVSLKEDLSEWIIKTLGPTEINAENFVTALDNGVILCQLSLVIEKKAKEYAEIGKYTKPLPSYKMHCNKNAKSGTWLARDNTANFLKWCRAYEIKDEHLFDSEDLVTHHREMQVIYCLMEIARLGARFGLEPPTLIFLEEEIEKNVSTISNIPHLCATNEASQGEKPSSCEVMIDKLDISTTEMETEIPTLDSEDMSSSQSVYLPTDETLDSNFWILICLSMAFLMKAVYDGSYKCLKVCLTSLGIYFFNTNVKSHIYKIALKHNCLKNIKKISQGLYSVFGKQIFIRLLKGRHLMVRVGGGWDTFENYVVHHESCITSEIKSAISQVSTSQQHSGRLSSKPAKPVPRSLSVSGAQSRHSTVNE